LCLIKRLTASDKPRTDASTLPSYNTVQMYYYCYYHYCATAVNIKNYCVLKG